MKLKKKEKSYPGETRTRRYFALWPVTIGADRRWLEMVAVKETSKNVYVSDGVFGGTSIVWDKIRFVDK